MAHRHAEEAIICSMSSRVCGLSRCCGGICCGRDGAPPWMSGRPSACFLARTIRRTDTLPTSKQGAIGASTPQRISDFAQTMVTDIVTYMRRGCSKDRAGMAAIRRRQSDRRSPRSCRPISTHSPCEVQAERRSSPSSTTTMARFFIRFIDTALVIKARVAMAVIECNTHLRATDWPATSTHDHSTDRG